MTRDGVREALAIRLASANVGWLYNFWLDHFKKASDYELVTAWQTRDELEGVIS